MEVLLPLYKLSQAKYTQESQLWASTMLTRYPIYPSSILRHEVTIWLQAISRRLGGKSSIRHPYYSEIHRDIPYDIFKVILKAKSMQGQPRTQALYSTLLLRLRKDPGSGWSRVSQILGDDNCNSLGWDEQKVFLLKFIKMTKHSYLLKQKVRI